MSNLRIVSVTVNSSTQITANFTEALTPNLTTSNIIITSATAGVGDAQVLSVSITSSYLTVTCNPLIEFAAYYITYISTQQFPFESLNGDATLPQDGVSNVYLITGPISPDNPVKDYLVQFFNGNIYNTDDETSVISQYINSLAVNLARCLHDIRQCKNENYLSFQVVDEQQFRGQGAYDRLFEESVYQVNRVGLTPTGANAIATLTYNDFPGFPVTLQQQANLENLSISSNDDTGTFDIDSLILNLSNFPVTIVSSIVFTQNTVNSVYVYNIPILGYQLLNSTFDQNYASTYQLLLPNQVKLNAQLLNDPLFDINQIISVAVEYQNQDLGINVDSTSIDLYTIMTSVREVVPPIENIFTLQHAPITDSSNNIPITGGVTFLDPNSNTGSPHPAFLMEIPFSLSAPPSAPGVYSINYNTGMVYVYGADITNSGTGPYPPLATYYYRYTYVNQSDYAYDLESLELVALPLGNLINNPATLTYNYEKVLIPGTDYNAEVHIEAINEPVQNRLVALNSLTTLNSPITNVFQIYNRTSGEIYTLTRWTNDNQIYFQYNNPPNLVQEQGERTTFQTVSGELLFINNIGTNINSIKIFTIFLANNTIIDGTEDGIGSSINSSMSFNSNGIFLVERWYNQQLTVLNNIDRILNAGEYLVDYTNGIIYLGASNTQSNNIGSVNYKMNDIIPQFPHIISVDDIYYRISPLLPKNKHFSYLSFADGSIVPEGLDVSDEAFLNSFIGAPYQVYQGQIGTFMTSGFVPGVTNQVKFVRSIFEYDDLLYNTHPINFATASTSSNFNINVNSLTGQYLESVQFNGTSYFLTIPQILSYLSMNIVYNFSVIRVSDGAQLWNSSGVLIPGNPITLVLPGVNNPQPGNLVAVTYNYTIQPVSRVIVDYNKGDFFVDYTYLADEIIVSYEYGDNIIDFSQSNSVSAGTPYYVTYQVGALRDALVQNFGSLVNLPQLDVLDVNFPRERYRDALVAALTSFLQGPTVAAIKNIGQVISHIEPQVIESVFQTWSLGQGILYPNAIQTNGSFQLLPAHFNDGALVNQSGQTISLPVNSNCRFEEGTFTQWIVPRWNGLDNDANLVFNIMRAGVSINQYRVFIGASEYHPEIIDGCFQLDKNSNVTGKPNTNKDGVFIWYGPDFSGNFNRWYMEIIDGYVASVAPTYKIKITSNGKFYDSKCFNMPIPSNATIFTGINSLNINITTNNTPIQEGFTFLADLEHYLLDLGKAKDRSRLSIYKDPSGYMNFRVWDRSKTMYSVSADVSGWKVGQAHQVAASWKLNTRNSRDEMHLFIDGLEVPNIIKYGQKLQPYLHEKFRTVDPEEIVGLTNRDIVGSHDLTTTIGLASVSSSINFSQFNIFPGDTIFINEVGFSAAGYQIASIDGQTLTLNTVMPLTLNADGNFSVNQTSFVVISDIDTAPNIAVSTISPFITGSDLSTIANSNSVSSTSINFTRHNVMPGYSIRIDSNSPILVYTIVSVENNTLIIDDRFPFTQSDITFQVYSNVETELPGIRALYPDYSISQNTNYQNVLTVTNGVYAGDLVLIRTLGINSRDISQQYYVWSNQVENVLMTQLPPPISLNETNITRIITPVTAVGPTNSTVVGGIFYSDQIATARPSNSQNGRTIQCTIAGTNVDFSIPVEVTINGVTGISIINETIIFNDYGTLDFANSYTSLNYVTVTVMPTNPAKAALTVELQEKYPITYSEFSGLVPVIRYSYLITLGYNLRGDGYDGYIDGYCVVTDQTNLFSAMDIGNYLVIQSPPTVAGFYYIIGISEDRHSLYIQSTITSFPEPLATFSNGTYQVLDTTDYRSGLQNGFFTLEASLMPGQAWFVDRGFYEFDYSTYLSIKLDPLNSQMFFGSDMFGFSQANAILDQTILYSIMLTDTRVGETVQPNRSSITKNYNSLIPIVPTPQTLVLINFDTFPFANIAPVYANLDTDRIHFQSNWAVNQNFQQSVVILDKPILLPNAGILDTTRQGTIEFWMSPLFDTANDPNIRYYFDAYGAVVTQAISNTDVTVKINASIGQILSVKLAAGDPNIDYFAGGAVELDTRNAVQEEGTAIGVSSVKVSQPILQVITVKILGDFTNTDYFAGGSLSQNLQTIYLGKILPVPNITLIITYVPAINNNLPNTQVIRLNRRLPNQNTPVIVNYIPQGLQGDRISIYKDIYGFINFSIIASGIPFVVSGPTRWARNTWHRVKAQYQVNGGFAQDQMRLFLDGYQYTDVLFGEQMVFGRFPVVSGAVTIGDGYSLVGNINFKDPINDLFIGSQYNQQYPIYTLLDNFRISNIFRPIYAPFGEPIDVNWSSNLNTVIPVAQDLYTTYLLDYNDMIQLEQNFAILTNREVGSFDFTVNIFDSFGIVSSSSKVQSTLETLINTLKPANTIAFINYTE